MLSLVAQTIFRRRSKVSGTPSISWSPFQITPAIQTKQKLLLESNRNNNPNHSFTIEQVLPPKKTQEISPKKRREGDETMMDRIPSQSKRKASTESTRDRAASAVRRGLGSPLAMDGWFLGCCFLLRLRWFLVRFECAPFQRRRHRYNRRGGEEYAAACGPKLGMKTEPIRIDNVYIVLVFIFFYQIQ